MTTYVTTSPHGFSAGLWHLWADTPDEALLAAFGAGVTTPAEGAGWNALHYEIGEAEWCAAVGNGAVMMTHDETVRWIQARGLGRWDLRKAFKALDARAVAA